MTTRSTTDAPADVLARTRFSVLDRSRTRTGEEPAEALRATVRFAQEVEALGYHRFWVSEHHSVPGVAGSAPAVLAAAVASVTSRIRVGTGGVMLPNHQPMVVAEQFGVLESLHPGRIDMGLGRSVGFTEGVRRALGRDKQDADDFAGQLRQLLGWFTGEQADHPQVHAHPAEGLRPAPFVLAMGSGATIAAAQGLPLVIGDLSDPDRMQRGIDTYRDDFRPSWWAEHPYVVISGTVAVGATTDQARRLLIPEAGSAAYSRTRGVFPPLAPAAEIEARPMTGKERTHYEDALRGQIHGTAEEVVAELAQLVALSGADEVLVTTSTYDRADLIDSYRRLADALGLRIPEGNRLESGT